jgi:4-hydroxy-2-oxoheptanedioate aldolase
MCGSVDAREACYRSTFVRCNRSTYKDGERGRVRDEYVASMVRLLVRCDGRDSTVRPGLKELLCDVQGEPLIGTFLQTPSPVISEVCGGIGVDFICVDSEHSAIDRGILVDLIRGADVVGLPTVVRVGENSPGLIGQALDAGATGVLVPYMETGVAVAAAVSYARYPPLGRRGVGPGRATSYGRDVQDYVSRAGQDILVGVQVESVLGVERITEILAVEGLDFVFIGPNDLAFSMGFGADPGAPEVSSAIEATIASAVGAGMPVGIFAPDAEQALRWIVLGCRFVVIGSDLAFLASGARSNIGELRDKLSGI